MGGIDQEGESVIDSIPTSALLVTTENLGQLKTMPVVQILKTR
jgi:hypothetical protein